MNLSVFDKRQLIDTRHPSLSIARQCELLGLSRSSYYYEPKGESAINLKYMKLIDKQFLETPFYGVKRMTYYLRNLGYIVNEKRVRRLMRLMNLQAIYPKPRTSICNLGHEKYPYLLRNVPITYKNQVWSTDITYIGMERGFMYLVAVIDWYSRYVLSWEISNHMDTSFCIATLKQALAQGKPNIFNTDQGTQFTAQAFTQVLKDHQIQISMDGRGRAIDNVFIERLWRSVKYEDIFLQQYKNGIELWQGLQKYFDFYNYQRPHLSLNGKTPAAVYFQQQA